MGQAEIFLSQPDQLGPLLPRWSTISQPTSIREGHIEPGERVNFVVPTGNFGNILAGFYASLMGCLHKLICAANRNHVLTDFFRRVL